jgi:hypothetical protein
MVTSPCEKGRAFQKYYNTSIFMGSLCLLQGDDSGVDEVVVPIKNDTKAKVFQLGIPDHSRPGPGLSGYQAGFNSHRGRPASSDAWCN